MLGELQSGYRFNDDILTTPSDQLFVRSTYPKFAFAFDFQPIRDLFVPLNDASNLAKRRGRAAGIFAIAIGVLGWFIACAEPGYSSVPLSVKRALLLCAALFSLASVVVGVRGLLYSSAKLNWLKGRFLTERLRQFHFQNLVLRLPALVDASADDARQRSFTADSVRFLRELQQRMISAHRDAEFDRIVKGDDDDPNWLLHTPGSDAVGALGEDADEFFRAYRELRIRHQISYAWHQLRDPVSLLDFPIRRQERVFGLITLAGTGVLFFMNAFQAFSLALGIPVTFHPWDLIGAMWIAIVALAIRTAEEGLQSQREVERYENYRTVCQQIQDRFDGAKSASEKFEAMLALERASYEEMRLFLRTNLAARFVL